MVQIYDVAVPFFFAVFMAVADPHPCVMESRHRIVHSSIIVGCGKNPVPW